MSQFTICLGACDQGYEQKHASVKPPGVKHKSAVLSIPVQCEAYQCEAYKCEAYQCEAHQCSVKHASVRHTTVRHTTVRHNSAV